MFKVLLLSIIASYVAAAPPLVFDCANMPDVCTNMCWGAYCTRPNFGVTLNYDNYGGQGPNGQIARDRRKNAGCGRGNRCDSANGDQCDEYPFASTSDASKGGQVSRCIPRSQNSRQGNAITQYRTSNSCGNSCELTISFGNPGADNVAYCFAYQDRAGKCLNDQTPAIFKRNAAGELGPDANWADSDLAATKVSNESTQQYGVFMLASGMEVVMPSNTPLNSTAMRAKPRDESGTEWEFEEDSVVGLK